LPQNALFVSRELGITDFVGIAKCALRQQRTGGRGSIEVVSFEPEHLRHFLLESQTLLALPQNALFVSREQKERDRRESIEVVSFDSEHLRHFLN